MGHNLLQDPKIFQWLYRVDEALAEETRTTRCACGGKWHRADYPRKPRGCLRDFRMQYASRFSFCCSHCRKRRTSPSVRVFGRRVMVAAAIHGSASLIVTFNLKDFPPERLKPYNLTAQHPDDFIFDLWTAEDDPWTTSSWSDSGGR